MLWETFQSGVLKVPSEWSFFLSLELSGTVIGAMFYALIEHVVYRSLPKRDLQRR